MTDAPVTCNFCSKTQKEVRKLIAGAASHICDECIQLSTEILAEETEAAFPGVDAAEAVAASLRAEVVGQPAAIAAVVGALRQHLVTGLEPADLPTPTILLAGPVGCGKTTLARALVDHVPLPSVLGDLDRITATGYVGDDIEQLLNELLQRATHTEHAHRGVLAIDNLDRLVPKQPPPGSVRDVSGLEVQRALLRILEGYDCTSFDGRTRHPQQGWSPFPTRGLMRVLLATTPSEASSPSEVRDQLREAGVSATLLSRVHLTFPMRALSREDLHEVLTRDGHGLLPRALAFLERAGVTLAAGVPTIERIVDRAAAAKDGAWSLERQVAGIVHDVASRGASGRLIFTPDDLDRIDA